MNGDVILYSRGEPISDQEEVEKRVEFESRWKELIKTHIGELAQYQDADIERIRNCIALLNSSSHSYVELTSLLDKRLKRGNVLVDLRPPYKNISEVFEQGVVNDVEKEDLRLQLDGGAEYVWTSIPSTNAVP